LKLSKNYVHPLHIVIHREIFIFLFRSTAQQFCVRVKEKRINLLMTQNTFIPVALNFFSYKLDEKWWQWLIVEKASWQSEDVSLLCLQNIFLIFMLIATVPVVVVVRPPTIKKLWDTLSRECLQNSLTNFSKI
jgi:hypothetical protein